MKRIVQLLLLFGSACGAVAQGYIFSPPTTATVEGNSSVMAPFVSSSFRFQQVYAASQFGSVPVRITEIAFRVDGASASDVQMNFSGTTMTLSTTPVGPDGLSSAFSFNIGLNTVTVRTGGGVFSGQPPAPGSTASFAFGFTFDTPYLYNPAQGNLLVDLVGAGGRPFFPGAMDAQSAAGDSVSWVFALNGSSPSGTANTLGLVTRFGVGAVPEPSTWLLATVGLVIAAAFGRRWRRR